jgi:hypothetical protein
LAEGQSEGIQLGQETRQVCFVEYLQESGAVTTSVEARQGNLEQDCVSGGDLDDIKEEGGPGSREVLPRTKN